MHGPDDIDSDDDALRRQAIGWLLRLTSGAATAADREALAAWRGASPAHEAAFRAAAALWRELGPAAARAAALAAPGGTASGRPMVGRRALLGGGAIAASLLAAAAVGPALRLWPAPDMLLADHRTGIGEQREVTLPDGSRILLDAETAIDVAYEPTIRRLRLLGGEALFSVVPDAGRPFVVEAGPGATTAIGTVFTVRAIAGSQGVQCLEGKVALVPRRGARPLMLAAGHGVSYGAGGADLPQAIDPATAAPWRNGLLVFRDEPLGKVVAELNRYRQGRIVVLDAAATRRVTGVFHLARPNEALDHLRRSLGLDATEIAGGYVVLH